MGHRATLSKVNLSKRVAFSGTVSGGRGESGWYGLRLHILWDEVGGNVLAEAKWHSFHGGVTYCFGGEERSLLVLGYLAYVRYEQVA